MIPLPLLLAGQPQGALGRSLFRSIGHGVASAGRKTSRVASRAGRTVGHAAATAGRAIGHAVADLGRMATREAKRIVRRIARPMVASALHGEDFLLLGDDSPESAAAYLRGKKQEMINRITNSAQAAVTASVIAAPAAPAVPYLLPPILEELIQEVAAKGRAAVTGADKNPDSSVPDTAVPASIAAATAAASPRRSGGGDLVIPVAAVAVVAAIIIMRRRSR